MTMGTAVAGGLSAARAGVTGKIAAKKSAKKNGRAALPKNMPKSLARAGRDPRVWLIMEMGCPERGKVTERWRLRLNERTPATTRLTLRLRRRRRRSRALGRIAAERWIGDRHTALEQVGANLDLLIRARIDAGFESFIAGQRDLHCVRAGDDLE